METILVAFLSSVSSVGLIALLTYLCRNWLLERLKASVKHEYDLKLESYKSQITRCEQAYEEIIVALYDMIKYFRVHKEDYGQGTGLSDDRERELLQEYIRASSSLSKATDIGAFYISQDAVDVLQKLRSREQLDYYNEPKFEFYEQEYKEHDKAMKKLVEVAKHDLKRT
ncbi:hypothetical protein CW740_00155 [Kangiella profundi]|uniref:Uncharacterized protein n=1 Tax=Kangiella profundi TaxID=1561924 RepID=A0A2K9A4R2_9GAMM|nr:hypothetical protein [Kangiella profundi]AUD77730.1 hypothetical protein CW740_00155 [Kangiella profundi]GGE93135.1 hypothetical protein GCM10011356_03980 [Kangiella profundi]